LVCRGYHFCSINNGNDHNNDHNLCNDRNLYNKSNVNNRNDGDLYNNLYSNPVVNR
jgi:hypothetical protein